MNANIRGNGSLASFKQNVLKSFLAEQKLRCFLDCNCIYVSMLFLSFSHNMFYLLIIIFLS